MTSEAKSNVTSEVSNEVNFLAIVQDLVKAFCRAMETEYRPGTMADAIVHTLAGLMHGSAQFCGDLERRIEALETKLAG